MRIRVGILGCAAIAKRSLAPAFLSHPAFELVAVASRTSEKARGFIESIGAVHVHATSYDALVASEDIDLVYCPLPTGLHYAWVKRCLESGKHVLCEKSLACSYKEVGDLVALAKAHGCFLMESFQFRFHPQNVYVRELLQQNVIGDVRQVLVRFGIPPFPEGHLNIRYLKELGGGAIFDNGAYVVKATTYLFGHDFHVVCASATVPQGEEVDICGTATFQSASGVISQTAYGFDHFYQNGYEIWGSRGMIKTSRAFTARLGYAAEVVASVNGEVTVRKFDADHFVLLLDYIAATLSSKSFEHEYKECLVQAKLLEDIRDKALGH